MTGWRIGYAGGDPEVIKAMGKIQSQSTSNPTSISQKAALRALQGGKKEVSRMVREFKKRRDWIVRALEEIPGVSCYKPEGSFYVFPDFGAYLGKKFDGKVISTSLDLAEFLLEQARVAVVPGIAFGGEGHLRISFATSLENIKEGVSRIKQAVNLLR